MVLLLISTLWVYIRNLQQNWDFVRNRQNFPAGLAGSAQDQALHHRSDQ